MKEIILYVRKDIKAGKHVCEMGSNVENCQIRNKVLRLILVGTCDFGMQ